jgi:hypothetical protein
VVNVVATLVVNVAVMVAVIGDSGSGDTFLKIRSLCI